MNVLEIINQIAAEPGRNAKIDLVRENWSTLEVVLLATYGHHNLLISSVERNPRQLDGVSLKYAIQFLFSVTNGKTALNNQNRDSISAVANCLSDDDFEVFNRILARDLGCGVSVSTINAAMPGMIPTNDFSLASTDTSKIVYPCFAQVKEDGARVHAFLSYDETEVIFMTRNGNTFSWPGKVVSDAHTLLCNASANTILDGELVCFDDRGDRIARKTSNGHINKIIKGKWTPESEKGFTVHFVVWDLIEEQEPTKPYSQRIEDLSALISKSQLPSNIHLIETRIVQNESEVMSYFKEVRDEGLEGLILKNADWVWCGKRSKDQVKMKAVYEADFEITGVEIGTGKNAGRVGALNISDKDGKITCNVGIFKDMDESVRDDLMNPDYCKVVTVRYNERIKSKKDGQTESLFLPRVVSLRFDKSEGDSYEYIVESEKKV